VISAQSLHTFGLEQQVNAVLDISCEADLAHLSKLAAPMYILGQGSNTVFVDDFAGTVVRNQLRGISVTETDSGYSLSVASGENWHALVCWCLEQGMGGFENLALIPGTVGAAPIQNIGAYGVEIAQFITRVDYIDLLTHTSCTLDNASCAFGYRDSVFKHALLDRAFITHVHFYLPKAYSLVCHYGELARLEDPSMHIVFAEVCRIRQSKLPDPATLGNAGSFFKNPVVASELAEQIRRQYPTCPVYPQPQGAKLAAGWLIEQCGFKGQFVGGVQCHPQQALVLTNAKQASGSDVLAFARAIQAGVADKFGITLENEVRLLGRNGLVDLS
jgi:UDP-N-acetylmuramate dehydrogenase